ncbi:SDR family oxidoreductase [Actinoplanes sp. TBRC 11911]|uniref:SDR family oxidoreductase n=1 Tax=Actinoplanes sp. TBRC 11911 TaxID=2729386 RepID=UPI00145E20D6|nr:SDR family oxidoreductase [Actinoplanes sp. TBRC 11911]NMO53604.1 SDR family oxidoreductase [Actinoplanes sp. TBRC 11911]
MSDSKVVLVTGGGTGIGAATARRLAAAGHHVVLGARRKDRLAAVHEEIAEAGGSAEYAVLDVADPEDFTSFVRQAAHRHGRIDVLVNNAGVMPLSPLSALRVDDWQQMIDVNLRGVLHGIAAVLPIMRGQGHGHVINVGSTLAHQVAPSTAVYSAVKAAVRAVSEGLRMENPTLRVSVISPSFVESDLISDGGDPGTMAWVRQMAATRNMPASTIADAIAYTVGQPPDINVFEILVRSTVDVPAAG